MSHQPNWVEHKDAGSLNQKDPTCIHDENYGSYEDNVQSSKPEPENKPHDQIPAPFAVTGK